MENENQRQYELTLIFSPNLQEEKIASLEQEIEKEIKELEGSLKNKEKPEKRELAYPIKKFQSGYFVLLTFLLGPDKIKELFSLLKQKKDVIRYLISLTPEEKLFIRKKKPKPAAQKPETLEEKPKTEKFKKLTKEVTEKEIETLKKTAKEKEEKKKETKLEDIDKKLGEILGI